MFKDLYAKIVSLIEKILYPNLVEDLGLYETVLVCKSEDLARRITNKICNPDLLKKLIDSPFPDVRKLALNKLKDVKIAERVLLNDAVWQIRLKALQYVTSKRVLNKASLDQNKKVQKAAMKKLKETDHA